MTDDANKLAALIERLRNADGPSRELDARIAVELSVRATPRTRDDWTEEKIIGLGRTGDMPLYTQHVDAARKLVPKNCGMVLHGPWEGKWYAQVAPDIAGAWDADITAPTPALALCIAALLSRGQG